MRKTLLFGALAAAVMAMPAGFADESVVTTISTPDAPMADHLLLPGLAVPGLGDGTNPAACGATAPGATRCTTGLHLSMYVQTMGFVPAQFRGYTGTVETKETWLVPVAGELVPGVGTQTFRCNVVNNVFQSCGLVNGMLPAQFNWPPPGTVFEHTCSSFALGTTTPGGTGTWSCFVQHN